VTTGDIVEYIIVPFAILFLSGIGSALVALFRFGGYMARNQSTQEKYAEDIKNIAGTNKDISEKLTQYMERTDGVLRDYGERLKVVEFRVGEISSNRR
jgi:hypothetical protein